MEETSATTQRLPSSETKERSEIPDFVRKVAKDYPDEANRIISLLPMWKATVDRYVSIPGFAGEVLDATEYISKEDLEGFVTEIADEATPLLGVHPDRVVFVHYSAKTSGRYLFNQILGKIPEEIRDKAILLDPKTLARDIRLGNRKAPTNIFYCDDSSNSGQQIRSLLSLTILPLVQEPSQNPTIDLRLMRISDNARNVIETKLQIPGVDNVNWDIKAKRMPELADVMNKHATKLPAPIPELFSPRSPFGAPTLGIFYHKLQDNLPGIYLCGDMEVATRAGIEPLFQNSHISR